MHIFISYAKKDTRALAKNIRDALLVLPGITTWMDESLHPGKDWDIEIADQIRLCDLMIVLLSPDVNRKPGLEKPTRSFVINEILEAQSFGKTIIPMMAILTDIPLVIKSNHYIDFTTDPTVGYQTLLREIAHRAGISLPPIPPSQPPSPTDSTPSLYTGRAGEGLISRRLLLPTLGLIALVVAAVVIVLPSLNLQPTLTAPAALAPTSDTNTPFAPTFTDTVEPSLTPVPATPTTANTDVSHPTQTPILPTPTYTITVSLTPTNTLIPSSTLTPIPPSTTDTSAFTPITRNVDWTPHYETFNGVEMALVPVGCFMMGSESGENDEKPVHQQCFDQPFWIDRTEVTNAQFGSTGAFSGDNRPRDNVNWFEARDFCQQRDARLPTEREWEYAARGPDNLIYPWGNYFVADKVVYSGNSTNQTAGVGSRPAGDSWVGASDLTGNVWEWVSTIYQLYPYKSDDGREANNDSTDVLRVLRGGSYDDNDGFNLHERNLRSPSFGGNGGFRCARDY